MAMTERYSRLVAHITNEILMDDEDQSEMLADVYLSADQAGKDALDKAFICLCGWQLSTLMKQCATSGSTSEEA